MLLAHSTPKKRPDAAPQSYVEHIDNTREGAVKRAKRILKFCSRSPAGFLEIVKLAAHWHDLGKLDPGNQAALKKGRIAKLPVDHIDAGVAHVLDFCRMAAWLIRAHHSPGLPCDAQEKLRDQPFRGVRNRDANKNEHEKLRNHVNAQIDQLVLGQIQECCDLRFEHNDVFHGLTMRLALSCLVDSDHEDTATYDRGFSLSDPPKPRWEERIGALENYVTSLAKESNDDPERIALRQKFYRTCRDAVINDRMASCTGPVGIGKTTAVLAFLLRTAAQNNLERIFVVAPFTNIIDQTVAKLREAIVLPGEDAESIVVAHHHQTEYTNLESREFSSTWRSPIVVTTAVQFFESLAANKPGALRKLNSIPGSAVFLDEAHAAIPVRLWPQNWKWLNELSRDWNCHYVFASGSLIEFWRMRGIKVEGLPSSLPAIDQGVIDEANRLEEKRIEYQLLPEALTRRSLVQKVQKSSKPTLVILNTVQSAAVIARDLRENGENVLHVSTALCPDDRKKIFEQIKTRFKAERQFQGQEKRSKNQLEAAKDWILVATSCAEAGIDLSFQTAFRQSASTASTIQVGGRVNRHGERKIGSVIVFRLIKDNLINEHPDFIVSSPILERALARGDFEQFSPSELSTKAMKLELKQLGFGHEDPLQKAERFKDYPQVAKLGRVIDTDTRMVVVGKEVVECLDNGDRPKFKDIQGQSIQLWTTKIESLGLDSATGFPGIYVWRGPYDPDFLGYMEGVLRLDDFLSNGGCII